MSFFNKAKGWFGGSKPKNIHSLENLKFLYNCLIKNPTATESNRLQLIETLREISEILIWGDQNDGSVFDFFLEKQMITFFLKYMRQKQGRFLCVQLLQTLNILFENIRNETSLYYLLSNNHINSIIVHRFDFSDEEVMAYYISFLKTLSLKLNTQTIHFFYNERTQDFPLYVEAIKFFNHPESMVRIAVRTLTLNVYRVRDQAMMRYIRDKTAAPYFSNLVWFIGKHILDVDACVTHDLDHNSRDKLSDVVAEHLDHIHYLNDILSLNITSLNQVLTEQLLNRLLIPLYIYSLPRRSRVDRVKDTCPHVSQVVALFLLTEIFLVLRHKPLLNQLAEIIFHGDREIVDSVVSTCDLPATEKGFRPPLETLDKLFRRKRRSRVQLEEAFNPPPAEVGDNASASSSEDRTPTPTDEGSPGATAPGAAAGADSREGSDTSGSPKMSEGHFKSNSSESLSSDSKLSSDIFENATDDEKHLAHLAQCVVAKNKKVEGNDVSHNLFVSAVLEALDCEKDDYEALYSLCLLYAICNNENTSEELLQSVSISRKKEAFCYNPFIVTRVISVLTKSAEPNSKIRLATLEMAIKLLKELCLLDGHSYMSDLHYAYVEEARESALLLLRSFFKSEEMFLDMFEDEYRLVKNHPINVEYLTMDASILLPPTGTPLTGIEFAKRLSCGEVEKARWAIRVFFLLRELTLNLRNEPETQLPLTKSEHLVKVLDALDLNNSDLIACTIVSGDKKERRFLVIDPIQLILVEPDVKRLGWGIVKFVGLLQDVEVTGDKEDSRSLFITLHRPSGNQRSAPILAAKFTFDDHIRCMAAKQRLNKGRQRARHMKMQKIAQLLELPPSLVSMSQQASAPSTPTTTGPSTSASFPGQTARSHPALPGKSRAMHPGRATQMHSRSSLTSDDQTDNESNRSTSSLSTETQEPEKEKELLKSSVHRVVVVSRQRATSPSSMEAIPMSTFSQAESGKRSQGVTAADRQSSRLSSSRTGYPRVAQTRFMQHRPLSRTGKGTGARRLGTLPPARNSETRGRSRKSSGSAPAQGASASYWLLAKQEIDALYEKFVQRSGSNLAEKERSASASSLESDNQEIHLAPRRRFLSVPCVESLDDADLPLRSLSKEEDHGELTSSLPPQAKEEFLQRARKLKVNKSRSNSNASQ